MITPKLLTKEQVENALDHLALDRNDRLIQQAAFLLKGHIRAQEALLQKAEEMLEALAKDGCQYIFIGQNGKSCREIARHVEQNPGMYVEDFRHRIIAKKLYCKGCLAMETLAAIRARKGDTNLILNSEKLVDQDPGGAD